MQPAMTCAVSSRSRETADFLLMRGIVDFGDDSKVHICVTYSYLRGIQ